MRAGSTATLKRRKVGRWSEGIKAAVNVATHLARKYASRRSERDEKHDSGAGITTQNDNALLYRRRRAPKRVRRKARKRAKRCLKTLLSQARSNTCLFQYGVVKESVAGQQATLMLCEGMLRSTGTFSGQGTLYDAVQNVYGIDPEDYAGRIFLTRMSLDYSIKCRDVEGANVMELDVYEFVFRKDCYFAKAGGADGWLEEQLGDEANMPGSTVKMTLQTLGVVPFDANSAMSYIVIKSKRRYYISPGQTISFTRRVTFKDGFALYPSDFDNHGLSVGHPFYSRFRKSVSRGIILVQKGVPANLDGSPLASGLATNIQVRYDFKQLQNGENTNSVGFS